MFHNVIAFSASVKALMSKNKTFLLIMFLSRRAVRSLSDSASRVMMIVER